MGKVIVVANQKGGIGKTTTACALATTLAHYGRKTLLIDTDMQCNATDSYNAETDNVLTLFDLLTSKEKINPLDAVQSTSYGEIIPGDRLLSNAEVMLEQDVVNGLYKLQTIVKHLRDEYDYIIMDTNPAVNHLLINALIACDGVLIPITADRYPLIGLKQVLETIDAVKERQNPNLEVLGILVVRYKDQLQLERQIRASLVDISSQIGVKVFETSIRDCVRVKEAQAQKIPIIEYKRRGNIAKDDLIEFMKELLGKKKIPQGRHTDEF